MKKRTLIFTTLFFLLGFHLASQSMQWILQTTGSTNGSCSSGTDCDNDVLCYALEFTPSVTGTLTSYTTGFFINCVPGGNPILSNSSCIMSDNSSATVDCGGSGFVLFSSSGNSGTTAVTSGTPVILHQICLSLTTNQSVDIIEDEPTDLTLSIDEAGGGPVTQFPSFSDFEANYNLACDVLAVHLLSFDASQKDKKSELKWSTISEIDNDYFVVEWSQDGKHFKELDIVNGAGTTNQQTDYLFYHEMPKKGANYYRLKAVDLDGSFDYSPIRLVNFSSSESHQLHLFPNPAINQVSVNLDTDINKGLVHIQLRTITGQIVFEKNYDLINGTLTIPTSSLIPGTYLLVLESKQDQYMERFIKLN